jgi:cysteinyl-tRNA synthetase
LRALAAGGDALAGDELAASLRLIGFLREGKSEWAARRRQARDIDPAEVEALIAQRAAARAAKNFAESDRIRDQLAAMGVVLKDSKEGTTWEVAR